jgi:hypothetical protein
MSDTPKPMAMLPSGVTLNLESILFIARKEINQFAVFYPNTGVAPHITGQDVDTLMAYGLIQKLAPPPAANEESPPNVVIKA